MTVKTRVKHGFCWVVFLGVGIDCAIDFSLYFGHFFYWFCCSETYCFILIGSTHRINIFNWFHEFFTKSSYWLQSIDDAQGLFLSWRRCMLMINVRRGLGTQNCCGENQIGQRVLGLNPVPLQDWKVKKTKKTATSKREIRREGSWLSPMPRQSVSGIAASSFFKWKTCMSLRKPSRLSNVL